MKERPIIFNAPMVRALLDGTKTQTRRIMKTQPGDDVQVRVERFHQTVIDRRGDEQPGPEVYGAWWSDGEHGVSCPYGQPGDRLWVREAWRTVSYADALPPRELNPAHRIWYEAQEEVPFHPSEAGKLRPSMFIPRWASRITLEIASIRVERLQDISEADAIAEGCTQNHNGYYWGGPHQVSGLKQMATAVRAYSDLWESINGPSSWDANPWVWVIEFKRVEGGAA